MLMRLMLYLPVLATRRHPRRSCVSCSPPRYSNPGCHPECLRVTHSCCVCARRQCDNPGLRTRDGRLDPPPPCGASWKPWGQPRGPRVGHCRRESTRTCPCPLPCPLPSPTTVAIVLTVQTVCGRLRVRMIIEAQRKAGGFSLSPPPPASSPPSVPAFCPCLSSSMCAYIEGARGGAHGVAHGGMHASVLVRACLSVCTTRAAAWVAVPLHAMRRCIRPKGLQHQAMAA